MGIRQIREAVDATGSRSENLHDKDLGAAALRVVRLIQKRSIADAKSATRCTRKSKSQARSACESGVQRIEAHAEEVTDAAMNPKKTILRWDDDDARSGVSKSSIRRWIENGECPAPMKLGGPRSRAVGWRVEDIDRWIDGLAAA